MSKVVAPITATVEFITGVKSGQYGEYRSVLFSDRKSNLILLRVAYLTVSPGYVGSITFPK